MQTSARYAQVLEVAEREGVDGAVRVADGRALVPELAGLEKTLLTVAKAAPFDAARAAEHLLRAGGKRLRPVLLFLSARLFGREPAGLAELAAVAELVHSATLLHDDVIDLGEERRHQPAARVIWGNAVSVLAGDFLLTRSLSMARQSGVPEALPLLLTCMESLVGAEIHQLALRGRSDCTERDYWEVVEGKTASLFDWCARVGALAGGATPAQAEKCARFARDVGLAFQVADDLIDFQGTPAEAGKSVQRDLAEGKLTLPVLRALERRPELRARLGAGEDLPALAKALQETGAGEQVEAEARALLDRALTSLAELPEHPLREALSALAVQAVLRRE